MGPEGFCCQHSSQATVEPLGRGCHDLLDRTKRDGRYPEKGRCDCDSAEEVVSHIGPLKVAQEEDQYRSHQSNRRSSYVRESEAALLGPARSL